MEKSDNNALTFTKLLTGNQLQPVYTSETDILPPAYLFAELNCFSIRLMLLPKPSGEIDSRLAAVLSCTCQTDHA